MPEWILRRWLCEISPKKTKERILQDARLHQHARSHRVVSLSIDRSSDVRSIARWKEAADEERLVPCCNLLMVSTSRSQYMLLPFRPRRDRLMVASSTV